MLPNYFEQAAQITKAHGYDILSKQVQELKEENRILKEESELLKKLIVSFDKRTEKEKELMEELTESWATELAICHQAGGKINDFENVLRLAMEAAFYRTQADSID